MKKIISLILVLVLVLTLPACGVNKKEEEAKHIFEISKSAYDQITLAYEITDRYASDIYDAWYMAIYSKKDATMNATSNLADELYLSQEELAEASAYARAVEVFNEDWDALTEEQKDVHRNENPDVMFYYYKDTGLFSFCVRVVTYAYMLNGEAEQARNALDEAKILMKELSENYSDYEHYPNLKGYFTTTSSYFGFCENPDGSFEQYTETNNTYRNEIRDYTSDLDFIFED